MLGFEDTGAERWRILAMDKHELLTLAASTIASGMGAGEIFNMRGTPGLEPGIKNLAEFSVRIAVAISAEAAKHSSPGKPVLGGGPD
jgi:hypothetical protein